MSNEHNIYKLLNTLLLQSDIEDMNIDDKLDLMNKTRKEIDKEIEKIRQSMSLIFGFTSARGRYNEKINDILKMIN